MVTIEDLAIDFEFDLNDFEEFITESEKSDGDKNDNCTNTCICGVPCSENLIICSNKFCRIAHFHKDCVGLGVGTDSDSPCEDWFCEFCRNKGN